jgi:hypothetical protein
VDFNLTKWKYQPHALNTKLPIKIAHALYHYCVDLNVDSFVLLDAGRVSGCLNKSRRIIALVRHYLADLIICIDIIDLNSVAVTLDFDATTIGFCGFNVIY